MSGNLRRYSDEVWDRFFDFVFPCEDSLSRQEVQAELQRRRIDVRPALSRVKEALEARRARETLAAARETRLGLTARVSGLAAPIGDVPSPGPELRASLQQIISQLSGNEQAAYYHKLEKAASDQDLKSLLDDLHRLDLLNKDEDDGGTSGQ